MELWIKIKKLIHWIFIVLFTVPYLLYIHIFYINRYAKDPRKYPVEKRYNAVRRLVLYFLKLIRVKIDKEDMSIFNKMEGKFAVISNHQSDLDPLFLIALSEKPLTFVSKKEASKFPFAGKIIKVLDGIFIDRDNVMNQFSTIKQTVLQTKSVDYGNMIIYIEGTRNKEPENDVLEYHSGTLKTITMAGVPLIPMAIYGSFRILPLNYHLHHYPVYIRIFDPIYPEEYKGKDLNEMAASLQEKTNKEVDRLRLLDISVINGASETILDKKTALKVSRRLKR